MKMIVTNVRHPHDFMGDLRAMIGSARVGERRLLSLVESYGAKTVIDAVDEILDGAERQARACVRTWKDGVYRGVTVLDDDGHGATDIPIRATVTKKGDALTIDLSDSSPQVTGFVNSALPNTMSAVHMAFAYLIDPRTPKNSGTFRPVKVIAQAGHDRASQPAGAGDALHQPLRAGDRRVDHQGAGAGLPRARPSPAGAGASASRSRA